MESKFYTAVRGIWHDSLKWMTGTLGWLIWLILNIQIIINWPAWASFSVIAAQVIGFLIWINYTASPSNIRDRTDEIREFYSEKPGQGHWKTFDATLARWERNERDRAMEDGHIYREDDRFL